MSIIITIHFFLSIDGLKVYFEQHNDEINMIFGSKKTKYLTIMFNKSLRFALITRAFSKLL